MLFRVILLSLLFIGQGFSVNLIHYMKDQADILEQQFSRYQNDNKELLSHLKQVNQKYLSYGQRFSLKKIKRVKRILSRVQFLPALKTHRETCFQTIKFRSASTEELKNKNIWHSKMEHFAETGISTFPMEAYLPQAFRAYSLVEYAQLNIGKKEVPYIYVCPALFDFYHLAQNSLDKIFNQIIRESIQKIILHETVHLLGHAQHDETFDNTMNALMEMSLYQEKKEEMKNNSGSWKLLEMVKASVAQVKRNFEFKPLSEISFSPEDPKYCFGIIYKDKRYFQFQFKIIQHKKQYYLLKNHLLMWLKSTYPIKVSTSSLQNILFNQLNSHHWWWEEVTPNGNSLISPNLWSQLFYPERSEVYNKAAGEFINFIQPEPQDLKFTFSSKDNLVLIESGNSNLNYQGVGVCEQVPAAYY